MSFRMNATVLALTALAVAGAWACAAEEKQGKATVIHVEGMT